jgi:hypothetical protein
VARQKKQQKPEGRKWTDAIWAALIALLGIIVGSFLNPLGERIVRQMDEGPNGVIAAVDFPLKGKKQAVDVFIGSSSTKSLVITELEIWITESRVEMSIKQPFEVDLNSDLTVETTLPGGKYTYKAKIRHWREKYQPEKLRITLPLEFEIEPNSSRSIIVTLPDVVATELSPAFDLREFIRDGVVVRVLARAGKYELAPFEIAFIEVPITKPPNDKKNDSPSFN